DRSTCSPTSRSARRGGDPCPRPAGGARVRRVRPARDRRNGVCRRVYPRQAPPLTLTDAADTLIASSTVDVARNVGILLGVVFWLATVYWVYKDARRRIEDPWLVGMATLLGAIPPFLGPLIYMLFRPPEYIED